MALTTLADFAPPDSDAPIVAWALAYARAGMPVFPVAPSGAKGKKPKKPLTEHGVNDATTDEAQIRAWWKSQPYADPAWAVPPEIIVVDLDVGAGANGVKDFVECAGVSPDDVETPQASTPRGGRHMVFSANGAKYKNGVRVNGAKIDVRTVGGYIVLAAGANGRVWLKPLSTPLAEVPTWIAPKPRPRKPVEPRAFAGETVYASAALRKACRAIEEAPNGEQEATLNRECYSIGGLVGSGQLDEEAAIAGLTAAADRMPEHAEPWGDLEAKIRRAVTEGMSQPRDGGADDGELVTIGGVEKRLTTLASLNVRYALLHAPGSASVYISRADFLPIQDIDLKRRLAGEVVRVLDRDGEIKFPTAFTYWTGHAKRHLYRRIVFAPAQQPADVYNLYRGLGVTPCEGDCDRILAHIEDVICSGNPNDAEAMLKLLAWQIQNIGKPSRIIVVLKSEVHQAGKGVLLGEIMLKIYGPSGFAPSTVDQVLGKFNDAIRGRSFLFLDEVLFAGDRKSADAIKRLSTTDRYRIETKNLPVVQCPVAVNLWLASNHSAAAYIEEHDARYWALAVSEHRVGDARYFTDLIYEIENGGHEAFAHHLLNMDVSDFVPARDVPQDNAVKREMIQLSVNPYDARKWLADCCHAERLIGCPDGNGGWMRWTPGAEHEFHVLLSAYMEWQKTVRTRVGPEPTPSGALGKALTKAGFGSRRVTAGMIRKLPDPSACLVDLYRLDAGQEDAPKTQKRDRKKKEAMERAILAHEGGKRNE